MSALVPSEMVERGKVALKNEGASLNDLAAAMVVTDDIPAELLSTALVPFPAVPKPLVITDDHKKALRALPNVFGQVQPDTRRALTGPELKALYDEREVLKSIAEMIGSREESIKTLVRHHMDVDAEERGVAVPKAQVDENGKVIVHASERDIAGHYVLCAPKQPERVSIPDTNQEWSREFRKGSVTIESAKLDQLLKDGEISREDYLAFTVEKRVFDADKARMSIKKNPALLALLAKITGRARPGTSLFVRKA